MSDKKYQIFVSSTFHDLADERQDAIRNILDLNHIPAGMELFPAADFDQIDYIKKVIDECDYYILIIGGRYGSLDAGGISYTEREYDYAVVSGKTVLAFVHSDLQSIPVGKSDVKPELVSALAEFRKKVMTGRLVREWSTRQSLEPLVLKSLIHAFNSNPQVGWIRANVAAKDSLIEQVNALLTENGTLKDQLSKFKSQTSIDVSGIAGLDDDAIIRYETRYGRAGDYRHSNRTAAIKWRFLFLSIASKLDTPKTDGIILLAFKEAAKEASIGYEPYSLDDTDKVKIKVQLVALGLIKAYVSQTTQGGSAEFLSLTERGRAVFMEGMVTRKA